MTVLTEKPDDGEQRTRDDSFHREYMMTVLTENT